VTLARHLVKAIPDLVTAGFLYWLWIDPAHFGVPAFRAAVFTLLLEFFVIHAGGFMAVTVYDPAATRRTRILRLAGWTAGYLAAVSLFALGFDAWWMVGAFCWFCFAKLQALWTGAPLAERDRSHAVASWALSVVVFLGAIFATVELAVPELGADQAIREAAGFAGEGGVWEREPHRALAGAVLYFALMGLARPLLAWAFAPRGAAEAVA
jgi:hypothetical protein